MEIIINEGERDFFERVVLLTNNVPKYNFVFMSNKEFVDYLKRKFSKVKLQFIYSQMLIGEKAEIIVNGIRDVNGFEIAKEYSKILKEKGFEVYFEKKVDERYCDLVAYDKKDKKVLAFEIKSNGDRIDKAISQIKDYSKWANEVYLIVDERKKYEKIMKEGKNMKFGVILYNQRDNNFNTIRNSNFRKQKRFLIR